MRKVLNRIRDRIVGFWKISDEVARYRAVDTVTDELEEMENIFGLLVLGSFVGVPAAPMQISLELMPYMERELVLMMEKVETANEPVSRLFSVFGIE